MLVMPPDMYVLKDTRDTLEIDHTHGDACRQCLKRAAHFPWPEPHRGAIIKIPAHVLHDSRPRESGLGSPFDGGSVIADSFSE